MRRYHRLWQCAGVRRCGFTYRSPIDITGCWHRCPARYGETVSLRPVVEVAL